MTFLGGCVRPGFETIARLTGLPEALELCDLVVTGEGRLDAQTASGKAPSGVAALARAAGKPVIAIVGSAEAAAGRNTFDAVYPLAGQSFDLADALRHAAARLEWTTAEVARAAKGGGISFRRPGR
jgi:glycerate kinase